VKCPKCRHAIPEGREKCLYCGCSVSGNNPERSSGVGIEKVSGESGLYAQTGKVQGIQEDLESIEALLFRQLERSGSKRRTPLSKGLQVAIFFLSMLLGGLIVWFFQ